MKSNVEEINSVQRKINITVPQERVTRVFEEVSRRYQKKTQIRGFRAGKAPLYLIKSNYANQISYEVSESLLDGSIRSAMEEHKIQPISRPTVTAFVEPVEDKEFTFSATVEIFPKIPLEDTYKSLEVSYPVREFSEKLMEKELVELRRYYATTSNVEENEVSLAKEGHLAVISYDGSIDGKKVDQFSGKNIRAAMGLGEIPKEIEEALVGMKKGERKEVDILFEDESPFKGKKLHVSCHVEDILNFSLRELDDDFAKELGHKSLEALKEIMRVQIAKEIDSYNKSSKENSLLEVLSSKVSFDIPPVILEQVIDGVFYEMTDGVKGANDLLKDKAVRERLVPEATKRAKNTLLLWEVAKAEKIDVSDAEIKDYIRESLGGKSDESRVTEIFASSKDKIHETLVFEKTLELMSSFTKFQVEIQK
jgi:trigger factor